MPRDLKGRIAISPREATQLYPFARRTWMRWLNAGKVPGAVRVSKRWVIPLASVERMMSAKGGPKLRKHYVQKLNRAEDKRTLDEALDEFGELPTPAEAVAALRKAKEAVDAKGV